MYAMHICFVLGAVMFLFVQTFNTVDERCKIYYFVMFWFIGLNFKTQFKIEF